MTQVSAAERLLDEERFADAVTEYRRAARSDAPDKRLLLSLGLTENEDRLAFSRSLAARHPDSFDCRLGLVTTLLHVGRAKEAVTEADGLLCEFGADADHAISIRVIRFRAAVRAASPAEVAEDLAAVRTFGEDRPAVRKIFSGMLGSLAAADKPGLAPALDELAADGRFAGPTAEFLRAKAEELRRLVAATAAVRGQADGTGSAADPETE